MLMKMVTEGNDCARIMKHRKEAGIPGRVALAGGTGVKGSTDG